MRQHMKGVRDTFNCHFLNAVAIEIVLTKKCAVLDRLHFLCIREHCMMFLPTSSCVSHQHSAICNDANSYIMIACLTNRCCVLLGSGTLLTQEVQQDCQDTMFCDIMQ